MELQDRGLPGVRQVAEGSQGASAERRGHQSLPASGGGAARDDPVDEGSG